MTRHTDIKGKRFGRWTVLERKGLAKHGRAAIWLCRCECGQEKEIRSFALIRGDSKSCGCLRKDKEKAIYGQSAKKRVYSTYKYYAIKRGFSFLLSFDEFMELTQKKCFYCGREKSNLRLNGHNNGDFLYNGVVRIDSTKGYVKENCVPCCEICNKAKRDLSFKDFLQWAKDLAINLFLRPSVN